MGRKAISVATKLERGVVVDEATGCWNWTGSAARGYGTMTVTRAYKQSAREYVHRASYELHVGPIPDGLVIDHLCRNTLCCNPEHLEPVAQSENVRRGEAPSQTIYKDATHCIRGHEFTPANTMRAAKGRKCRACHSRRVRESRARRVEANR